MAEKHHAPQYWILKSEPDVYPWSTLVKDGSGTWDGVRNYQAMNNMKAMQVGDIGMFYHSHHKEIVGLMTISRTAYPDHTDPTGKFMMVDVKPLRPLPSPVTLAQMKAHPALQNLALIRQSRLSVSPLSEEEAKVILSLGGA